MVVHIGAAWRIHLNDPSAAVALCGIILNTYQLWCLISSLLFLNHHENNLHIVLALVRVQQLSLHSIGLLIL